MVQIDSYVKELLSHTSKEEQKRALMYLSTHRNDPIATLILGVFRDAVVFRQMAEATIYSYQRQLDDLGHRILRLEENGE